MKKYLMIGLAALAIASCAKHDFETMTQAQIDKANYDAKFVAAFGQPASNQDWGFGSSTRAFTRANINVEGNLEKYENCPSLGSDEEADVVAYIQGLTTKPNTNPIQLQNYFVTQVHCGTEIYYSADGGAGIVGSAHMNNLHIGMESGCTVSDAGELTGGEWDHINNFNRGDNTDWNGNTLVEAGGTFDFAYHGSEDSKYHNRWIAIDGKNVPKTGGGNYDGYYYVCFDFEATVAGYTLLTNASYFNPYLDNGNGQWLNFNNIQLPGQWTAEDVANSNLVYEVDLYDQSGNFKEHKVLHFNNSAEITNISVGNFVGGNQAITPNSSYLDWVVRLVKATPKDGEEEEEFPETYDLRVMAEDLTVSSNSDFDFNDVVFDAKIDATAGKTYIKLLAAGGTLPLKIGCDADGNGGEEVHGKFGVGTGTMVNTYTGQHDAYDPVEFSLPQTWDGIGDIPVYVYKSGEWQLITAYTGMPASKFGCPVGTDWADEREDIDTKWDGAFTIWVGDVSKPFWADWNKE